jgi:hypothetical protein
MEVALTALFFYGIGNLLSCNFRLSVNRLRYIYALPFFLIISFLFSQINTPAVDMWSNIMGNGIPTYFNAFVGMAFIFLLSKFIEDEGNYVLFFIKKIFIYLGKNTYVILAFHQVVRKMIGVFF